MYTVAYDVSGRGTWCNQEVAGENAYAATFRKLTKTEAKVSRNEWNCDVTLVPEPDNPYSKRRTAISVRWRDQVVGYLPETDSHRYQQLRRITASGLQAQTHARVWKGDYRENFYSITISLPEPGLVVPLNDPPSSGYSLLPQGGSVQVTKESDHLDVLAEFVPPSGLGFCSSPFMKSNRGSGLNGWGWRFAWMESELVNSPRHPAENFSAPFRVIVSKVWKQCAVRRFRARRLRLKLRYSPSGRMS